MGPARTHWEWAAGGASLTLRRADACSFLESCDGEPFATVVTDPPYGTDLKGMDGKRWDRGWPAPAFWSLVRERTEEGAWLACFSGARTYHRAALALEAGGWAIRDVVAWLKPYAIGRAGGLKRGWEAVILASNGRPRRMNAAAARVRGGDIPKWPARELPDKNKALVIKRGKPANRRETRSPSSVVVAAEDEGLLGDYDKFFIVGRAPTREKGAYNNHPSVKPLSLMEHLIVLLNRPGGVVLDPFVGSGTTLVAAARLDVSAVGIEVDADYVRIAKRRIEDLMGPGETKKGVVSIRNKNSPRASSRVG